MIAMTDTFTLGVIVLCVPEHIVKYIVIFSLIDVNYKIGICMSYLNSNVIIIKV